MGNGGPDRRSGPPSPPRRRAVKRTVRILGVAGLAFGLVGLGGIGLLRHTPSSKALPAGAATVPIPKEDAQTLQGHPVAASGSLTQLIESLQDRLKAEPNDWHSYASLGLAYVQEARVTADPTYYPKAEGVLQRSLQLNDTDNFDALTGMASLSAARHDFAAALSWGEGAAAINPYNASVYAVIGDAQIELGMYPEAFDTFQKMIDIRPDLATYARVSYGWELQGSYPNAIKSMKLALDAASSATDAAWACNQLGDLYFNSGDLDKAEDYYRQGLARDETFVPVHAGLAKAEAARGQFDLATADYSWVVQRYPSPEYVIALGDLYTVTGQIDLAQQQYGLVHVEEQLLQANGVNVDLEIALFDADHHENVADGLAVAQAEWARRQSINVADALAWELYANGRYDEAKTYSEQALHLGTQNALFFFHRGMIEAALGQSKAARTDLGKALDINPHFSILWSTKAAETLSSLGGKP
jgi:tetratricopeptide (TPR) repeat protein